MKIRHVLLVYLAWLVTPTAKIVALASTLAPLGAVVIVWAARNPEMAIVLIVAVPIFALSMAVVLKAVENFFIDIITALQQLLSGKPVVKAKYVGQQGKTPRAPSQEEIDRQFAELGLDHARRLTEDMKRERALTERMKTEERVRMEQWLQAQS